MAARTVRIHLRALLCPDLTPCTKLVSLELQMSYEMKSEKRLSPTRIMKEIGVARETARVAIRRLKEPCVPKVPDHLISLSRLQIDIETDLITDKTLSANARALYCVLKGLFRMKKYEVLETYTSIAEVFHTQPRTIKSAIHALAKAGWIKFERPNPWSPIRIDFLDKKAAQQRAQLRRAQQRLEKSTFRGETLALLWCDNLVDSDHHTDDCYPDFLTNPRTGELLQADRYYIDHNVVIEFNGPQHDGATQWFSQKEAEAQQVRDRIKREICEQYGIPFITLRPEDLSFKRLRQVLGKVLPLQDVGRDNPTIRLLEKESRKYLRSIERIRQESGQLS